MVGNREIDKDVHGQSPGHPEYAKGIQGDKRVRSRWRLIREGLVYGAVAAVLTIALALGASSLVGNKTEESTFDAVQILRRESEWNREVVCLAVVRPGLQKAISRAAYRRIIELCGEVIDPVLEMENG